MGCATLLFSLKGIRQSVQGGQSDGINRPSSTANRVQAVGSTAGSAAGDGSGEPNTRLRHRFRSSNQT